MNEYELDKNQHFLINCLTNSNNYSVLAHEDHEDNTTIIEEHVIHYNKVQMPKITWSI